MTQHDYEIGKEIGRQIMREHIDPLRERITKLEAALKEHHQHRDFALEPEDCEFCEPLLPLGGIQ
jgi:hypothetical protein